MPESITGSRDFMPYLFCYFTGNEPQEESVHFAVSANGIHFNALNNNEKIITQTLGKRCCRDPFIFRDEENRFHILATDMCCHDGWSSNNSMVFWDSDDLIHWENERIIDFTQFPETKNADRVWAPQAIFDKYKNEYMLYWSNHNKDDDLDTIIWYAYTKDFINLTTPPAVLFEPKCKLSAIDADIIEAKGKYYLYEADGGKDGICYAVSDRPDGPYFEPENNKVSVADTALEGNCIYPLENTDKYIMIADQVKKGGYFAQITDDLVNFKRLDDFKINHIKPRHGSMLIITEEEYNRLINAFK